MANLLIMVLKVNSCSKLKFNSQAINKLLNLQICTCRPDF